MAEVTYILKNRHAFRKATEVFKDFNESFQRACSIQMNDETTFVSFCVSLLGINFVCQLTIDKEDIEVREELKPFVWYDRSEFDGNPDDYILVEEEDTGYLTIADVGTSNLYSDTKRFMYLTHY